MGARCVWRLSVMTSSNLDPARMAEHFQKRNSRRRWAWASPLQRERGHWRMVREVQGEQDLSAL